MTIVIQSTRQSKIRSFQSGDWWSHDHDEFTIHVLETMSPESQLAVAIHELVEAYLCRKHGVTDEMVCAFDDKYEAEREQGKHKDNDEPGDDPAAPYRQEHMMATHVERAVCHAIGLSWQEHEQSVIESGEDHPKMEVPDSLTGGSHQPRQ
jgi:hypothetical protein